MADDGEEESDRSKSEVNDDEEGSEEVSNLNFANWLLKLFLQINDM